MTAALRLVRFVGSVALCGIVFKPVVATAGILDILFPSHELEAITVTDMTPAGALRRSASPAQPIYYAAVSGGFHRLGGAKAGEKPVAREFVTQTMVKVLAKQGYLPARPDQMPDIVLVWSWGTFNTMELTSSDGSITLQVNRRALMRFMGGDKLGLTSRTDDAFPELSLAPGLIVLGADAQRIYDTASDDLYIATISAYDPHVKDGKHAVLLWNTRISCPARGFWLPEAMPAMLAIAGPNIGRETARPVWVRATEKFKPEVTLGDTKVVEYLQHTPPTVVEIGPSH